ncbi:MAG: ATP synthase F1 subunit gamma [Candidatus Peribacteraceae bacterium]|nr:ATP synthase F1 subunit gamma [Candidatus Peribacteraceae bacterium]
MPRSLRDLRRKMKAIRSTRQVTKAMELVSASKMRRSVGNATMLRKYAFSAWKILERLADVHPELHPYLSEKPATKVLAILFTPDRGMCGNLNAAMARMAGQYLRSLKNLPHFERVDFIAVGKKGQHALVANGASVIAAFPAITAHPTVRDILPITKMATEGFLAGTYDHVVLLFPDCISALVQDPMVKVLLPLSKSELKEMILSILPKRKRASEETQLSKESATGEYLFEPSQDEVLATILPKLTEMQIYQAALETAASEHSARMVAMRAASDNATSLLGDLTLTYNRTRQEKITAELSEISAAVASIK